MLAIAARADAAAAPPPGEPEGGLKRKYEDANG
jgi:hypothetical protein